MNGYINHKEHFGERIIKIGLFLQVVPLNYTFTIFSLAYYNMHNIENQHTIIPIPSHLNISSI